MAPKSYRCKFIEPGLISYEDSNAGTVLVSKDALDRMAPSFRGCPVIFVPEHHNDTDKENAFNFDDIGSNPPAGIVTDVPTWGDDGWQWVNVLIWDEDAQAAIEKGYTVSCAYLVDGEGPAGEYHQISYDEEVTEGHYMHMAIVPRPRYEGSQILANSKGGHQVAIFNRKANAAPAAVPPKKPEAPPAAHPEPDADNKGEMLNDDTEVDVNGTPVPLHELIAKYMESQGAGTPAALGDADEVELPDGTKVTVADLKAAYTGGGEPDADNQMANAEPPTDTVAEPVVDPSKQHSNSAPVRSSVNRALKNAVLHPEEGPEMSFETESTRLARGKELYSKPITQGGK